MPRFALRVVSGQLLVVLLQAVPIQPLHRRGDLSVQFSTLPPQHVLIDRLLGQHVLERVLLLRNSPVLIDQHPVLQLGQGPIQLRLQRHQLPQQPSAEEPPDHGSTLQHLLGVRLQAVHAAQDDTLHALRYRDSADLRPRSPPRSIVVDQPRIDQRAHHLLQEERVALRLRQDLLCDRGGHGLDGQQRLHEPATLLG